MEPLETAFSEKGFDYAQVERQGMLAIFTQTHRASGRIRYELIEVQRQPAHTWPDGRETPAHEAYPGARQWGRYGWTYFTLHDARQCLDARRRLTEEAP